jgi:hypothetical protein
MQGLAVNHPTVDFGAFIFNFLDLWDSLAELACRHAGKKRVGRGHYVGVCADETVTNFHLEFRLSRRFS